MRRHGVDENLWTNILGGEAAIWSEQTSEDDVLSKVNYEAPPVSLLKETSIYKPHIKTFTPKCSCIFSRWSRELQRTERGCG